MTAAPGKREYRRSYWLLLAAYAIYGVSLLVPAVDLGSSEMIRGTVPGWVCAWIYFPAWPLNAGLLLLGLAYWRLRRTQEPFWRTVGSAIALAAVVAQIVIGGLLVSDEGMSALLVGYYLWIGAALVFAAAFLNAPAIAPSARES